MENSRQCRWCPLWAFCVIWLCAVLAHAGEGDVVGWRGNWTGLWPDAKVPLQWHRIPKGVMEGVTSATTRPADDGQAGSAAVEDGLVAQWLVIGPWAVGDSAKDFSSPQMPDEADPRPVVGRKVGELSWQWLETSRTGRWDFGTTELEWTDLTNLIKYGSNQIAYAHAYVHAPQAGRVRAVVEHGFGLKAWVNGHEVYCRPDRGAGLGSYAAISRCKLDHINPHAPEFEFDLQKGWSRLCVKISTANKPGWNEMKFCLRLMDLPDVAYDSRNILWMTELPERGNATPIIVGDRIFVMAEPDELLCIDCKTGRVLWSAMVNYYEATPREQRDGNAVFREKIDPLVGQLKAEKDFEKRLELRRKIESLLVAVDRKVYKPILDGHLESHMGIVGFTTPTPCSDGKRVYVWSGNGVAACYDLEGNRQWITRIGGKLFYASSAALIGDKFVVYMGKLYGLDAATGKVLWEQKEVNKNSAAVQPARIAGVDVIVTQQNEVVRAADGQMLFRNKDKTSSDTGWAAPTILGDVVYQPFYGVSQFRSYDFSAASGDTWQAKTQMIDGIAHSRKPDGSWVDRYTPASPLIFDGLMYNVDIYSTLYIVDIKAKQTLLRHDLDFHGLFNYNAVPVAASPALIGKYIYLMDNQGTTLVLEPGRQYKQVAKNRIATQLPRVWAVRPQETISYSPIVTDGRRLYIRGEKYLYCIGEQ